MSFHFFHINELYSNADGSVQFIEFVGDANGQNLWAGQTMTTTSGVDPYTFSTNLPSSSTLGKSVLVATQGFADLGVVTPDYIIPDGFLSLNGGILDFVGMDSINYGVLPGGRLSIDDSGATDTNSPTNFDGDSGSIPGNPIVGTAAADTLTGISGKDFMVGLSGSDTLNGRGGGDTVDGGAGNDILIGSAGNDMLIGGTGKDTASYQSGSASGITLNLGLTGAQATGGAGTDTLSGIERATGSGFADKLTGSNSANLLKGLGGGDTLTGRGGDDTLNGGGGADKFVFNTALNASTNVDRVADFAPGIDRIHLDEDIFAALATGALGPGRFHSVPGATDANDATDRIIYDSANGNLYYDADGNQAGSSSILFASLTGAPAITANDFLIIA